jgi:hypothetical protein
MKNILLASAVIVTLLNAAGAGQVPIQDRQPAGSALRPAVMGPTGGVSTGHPLTTAAAFGILLQRRQRV